MTGRHELKYVCSQEDLFLVERRLEAVAQRDPHTGPGGTYLITSLYFDDYRNSCCDDNDAGSSYRCKYRARYYNGDISSLRLEKKIRFYGLGKKISCPMNARELARFFTGQVEPLLYDAPPLLRELAAAFLTRRMEPKSIVQYERMPFIYPAGNVRITLDRAITGSADLTNFLTGDFHTYALQPTGQELLEVKFDEILPGELRQAVFLNQMNQVSHSKYYLSRQMLPKGGL